MSGIAGRVLKRRRNLSGEEKREVLQEDKDVEIDLLKQQVDRYNQELQDKEKKIKSLIRKIPKYVPSNVLVNLSVLEYPCEKASMASISNLSSLINCTNRIRGQAANSASPTDIYILDMKSNFLYEGEHVKTIYMKTFISSMDMNIRMRSASKNLDKELAYEYMVYLSKIKDIVKLNICPYFVKVLGGNLKVSKYDITSLLSKKIKDSMGNSLIDNDITKRFLRNMTHVYYYDDNRPSIETPINITHLSPNLDLTNFLLKANYGYFMTEGTPNTITLQDYIRNNLNSASIDNFNIILFQLIVACRAMNLAKLGHNDLHDDNILVEKLDNDVKRCFLTNDGKNNKVYTIISPLRLRVYDFDRSFINGAHPYINDILLSTTGSSMSNNLVQKRDLAKIFSYFFIESNGYNRPGAILDPSKYPSTYTYKRTFLQNIANVLIKDSKDPFSDLKAFYEESGNFLNKTPNSGRNYDRDFTIFNRSWDEMLDAAYDLLPSYAKYDLTTQKGELCDRITDFDVYYMFPQAFDDEGNINLRELEKIKSSVIKDVCTPKSIEKKKTGGWFTSFPSLPSLPSFPSLTRG